MELTLEEAFAPIGVEGYDAFLTVARACADSRNNIEVCNFVEHFEYIEAFRIRLESDFQKSDPLRPKTPLYRKIRPQLRQGFDLFREAMVKIQAFIGGAEVQLLIEGCYEAGEALVGLREDSHLLTKEESELPKPNSAITELLAMLKFVESGMFEPAALANRAEDFLKACRRYREDVEVWRAGRLPSSGPRAATGGEFSLAAALGLEIPKAAPKPENKVASVDDQLLEESQNTCEELLLLESTLTDLVHHCRGTRPANLAEIRASLQESEGVLKKLQAKLELLGKPRIFCLHCSQEAQASDRVCSKCGAKLPEQFAERSRESILEGQNQQPQGPPRFANFVQMEEAIENYRDGKIDLDRFQKVIDWFSARVRGGQEQIKKLPPPPPSADEETEARAEKARTHFQASNQSLQQLSRDLQSFLVQQNQALLDSALEHLRKAESEMVQFRELMMDSGPGRR